MQTLVKDLIQAGWSETRIAEQVGSNQPTINRYKHGRVKSPRFDVGMALVDLHKREMKKKTRASAA